MRHWRWFVAQVLLAAAVLAGIDVTQHHDIAGVVAFGLNCLFGGIWLARAGAFDD